MAQVFDPHLYDASIAAACTAAQISIPLVRGVIQHESGWNPFCVGDNGAALGLMQVHRVAAEDVGLAADWDTLKQVIDGKGDAAVAAALSIKIGVAYLAKMLKAYASLEAWALAAYNQGPTVVNSFRAGQRYAETVLALKPVA